MITGKRKNFAGKSVVLGETDQSPPRAKQDIGLGIGAWEKWPLCETCGPCETFGLDLERLSA